MAAGKKTGGRTKGTPNRFKKIDMHFAINELNSFVNCIKDGGFYIYKHYLNNELVYIGKGQNNRAWEKTRSNSEHIIVFDQLKVEIFCSNLIEDEALCIEKALIKFHKPKFNKTHTKDNN